MGMPIVNKISIFLFSHTWCATKIKIVRKYPDIRYVLYCLLTTQTFMIAGVKIDGGLQ